jgi:hypothetical protein
MFKIILCFSPHSCADGALMGGNAQQEAAHAKPPKEAQANWPAFSRRFPGFLNDDQRAQQSAADAEDYGQVNDIEHGPNVKVNEIDDSSPPAAINQVASCTNLPQSLGELEWWFFCCTASFQVESYHCRIASLPRRSRRVPTAFAAIALMVSSTVVPEVPDGVPSPRQSNAA